MEPSIATLANLVALAAECRASVVELADDVATLVRRAQFSAPIAAEEAA
jgi:hypothetical protein